MIDSDNIDYDFIIAGAGLAGLTLASCLADSKRPKSMALIDPRQDFNRDHRWCWWDNVDGKIDVPFAKSWLKWKVSYKSRTTVCQSFNYPYRCIYSDAYYEHVLNKLNKLQPVKFFLKESLQDVAYQPHKVSIRTGEQVLSARLLFDSRPPKFDQEQLCQDFFGLHVQTSAKVFDPDCLTLMDFSGIILNDGAGFHFYYVLPFTQTEALVESVFVGFSRIDVEEHRRLIKQYLAKDFGVGTFEELQTEHGCIPMQRFSSKTPSARHYFLGTKGGLVRPSTGYAFAAIHKFSNKLAGLLEDEEMPVAPATLSPKARLFDSVLLTYLKQRPHDGPLLLSSLFSFVPADVIVRFLCDRSSLQDDATIIAAMPRKYELSSIMARTCL